LATRSAAKSAGAKTTSRLVPAGTLTERSTCTAPNDACTVAVAPLDPTLVTGTVIATSATSVWGRFGSVVTTRGSPMTRLPVLRSRT